MPILRNRADGGYILRGFVRAAHGFCTWQLTDDGVRYLITEGVKPGDRLRHEVFQSLVDRGLAFTGKSGVTESLITPNSFDDFYNTSSQKSKPDEIDAESEKLLSRWLPRLSDRAADVREQAAINLGKLAVRSTFYREQLVMLLLDFAVEEEYWHVILNGLLFYGKFASIPKIDAKWLEPFMEAYLELGAIPGAKQSGGWRELQSLIEEGHLTPKNPAFGKVVEYAAGALGAADDAARRHLFAILDWAEDNS